MTQEVGFSGEEVAALSAAVPPPKLCLTANTMHFKHVPHFVEVRTERFIAWEAGREVWVCDPVFVKLAFTWEASVTFVTQKVALWHRLLIMCLEVLPACTMREEGA